MGGDFITAGAQVQKTKSTVLAGNGCAGEVRFRLTRDHVSISQDRSGGISDAAADGCVVNRFLRGDMSREEDKKKNVRMKHGLLLSICKKRLRQERRRAAFLGVADEGDAKLGFGLSMDCRMTGDCRKERPGCS